MRLGLDKTHIANLSDIGEKFSQPSVPYVHYTVHMFLIFLPLVWYGILSSGLIISTSRRPCYFAILFSCA